MWELYIVDLGAILATKDRMKLKILSYNIHKGFNWNNREYQLDQIKKTLDNCDADIVFLQEVVGKNSKHQKKGLIEIQAEYLSNPKWPFFSYGKNAHYFHGHHGNLILSKFPLSEIENVNISTNRFERRGMIFGKVKTDAGFIYIGCTHLNLFHAGRIMQFKNLVHFLNEKVRILNLPIIIAGDFNDWSKSAFQFFEKYFQFKDIYFVSHGIHATTYPSFFPVLCLDRVYVKGFKVLNANVIYNDQTKKLSDHLPIYGEVELNE